MMATQTPSSSTSVSAATVGSVKHAAAAASGHTGRIPDTRLLSFVIMQLGLCISRSHRTLTGGCRGETKRSRRRTETHRLSLTLSHLVCSAKGRRGSLRASSFCHLLARRQRPSSQLANSECFFDLKQAGIHVDCVRPSAWTVAEEKAHTSCSFSVHLEQFLNILALSKSLFTLASFCVTLTTEVHPTASLFL